MSKWMKLREVYNWLKLPNDRATIQNHLNSKIHARKYHADYDIYSHKENSITLRGLYKLGKRVTT